METFSIYFFICYFYKKINRKSFHILDDDNFEYNPNLKYKKFNKDVNELNYNGEEKHLELINKTNM